MVTPRGTRKQGSCLEKEIMQGTMPGARRRGRPRTAWMDNIKTWTGLPVEESVRMIVDRDKWRKYTSMVWMYFGHSMLWPTLGSRTAKEERRAGTRCRQPEHLADSDGGRPLSVWRMKRTRPRTTVSFVRSP